MVKPVKGHGRERRASGKASKRSWQGKKVSGKASKGHGRERRERSPASKRSGQRKKGKR